MSARIVVFANKWWEAAPLVGVLTKQRSLSYRYIRRFPAKSPAVHQRSLLGYFSDAVGSMWKCGVSRT